MGHSPVGGETPIPEEEGESPTTRQEPSRSGNCLTGTGYRGTFGNLIKFLEALEI
jgi:hypothetical protein